MEGKNQFLLANCSESPVILEKHFFFFLKNILMDKGAKKFGPDIKMVFYSAMTR